MTQRVLIIGATSDIARAVASRLAERGDRLVLAGRNMPELERIAADLRARYQAEADVESFDASATEAHGQFIARCIERGDGALDGAVICHGYLPDQTRAQTDTAEAMHTLTVTYSAVVSVCEPLAAHLAERGAGWLAVISSVAGDRGRQSNYLYGSAKAGVSVYCQGLRNRLFHRGVHVLTVKPGFVATSMTEGLLDPNSPMVASAAKVAAAIVRGIDRRRNVIYTPWFWRAVMAVIRAVPEPVFKRLRM